MGDERAVVSSFRSRIKWLGLVVVAVALVAGCDWTAVGFGPSNTNFNPFEPALTESSVQHLSMPGVVRVAARAWPAEQPEPVRWQAWAEGPV